MKDRFDDFQIRVFEAFKMAVLEAVGTSYNIKSLVKIIQEHHLMDDLVEYMESIDTKSLLDNLMHDLPESHKALVEKHMEEKLAADQEAAEWDGAFRQFIDGKRLSEKEILFEEFCQMRFNEDTWKKRLKIRL